jgi:hypothetical protein
VFKDGEVATAPGWQKAYRDWAAAGWNGVAAPAQWGGQGLPRAVNAARHTPDLTDAEWQFSGDDLPSDDHCTNEWAGKVGGPWGEFEHAGIAKLKAEPGHDVYALTPAELAQWKQAAAPLEKSWGDNVRKVGIDPATAMKELKDQLTKYKAGY